MFIRTVHEAWFTSFRWRQRAVRHRAWCKRARVFVTQRASYGQSFTSGVTCACHATHQSLQGCNVASAVGRPRTPRIAASNPILAPGMTLCWQFNVFMMQVMSSQEITCLRDAMVRRTVHEGYCPSERLLRFDERVSRDTYPLRRRN